MIIHLLESDLFTKDPAVRFARRYKVSPKVWNEIWKRYGLLEHDSAALRGYFYVRTKKELPVDSLRRWLTLTEIYCKAQHIIRMDVRVVDTSYFGQYESALLQELTKHMQFGNALDSRTIV